jgi:hypothetical protein
MKFHDFGGVVSIIDEEEEYIVVDEKSLDDGTTTTATTTTTTTTTTPKEQKNDTPNFVLNIITSFDQDLVKTEMECIDGPVRITWLDVFQRPLQDCQPTLLHPGDVTIVPPKTFSVRLETTAAQGNIVSKEIMDRRRELLNKPTAFKYPNTDGSHEKWMHEWFTRLTQQ